MITILIFIFIAFFIWGRITSSKVKQNSTITAKTPPKNPKERFREYVMKLMHNTIIENRKPVRHLNNIDQIVYVMKALEACKDHLIEMAFDYSLKYDISTDEVKAIVEDCEEKSMKTIKY